MKQTFKEPYKFEIKVIEVTDNDPKNCRMGFEINDEFSCEYGTPENFCQKSMCRAFTLMEVIRSGGDLRKLCGGTYKDRIIFSCPDREVKFELIGIKTK